MVKTWQSYIKAIAALAGTTIGAGIFGIPYVMAQSGVVVGIFWILFMGFILTITNLLHGEFSLRSRDDLKFVGIARRYLSPFWGKFTGILTIISFYGSLLAYVIIGGQFLNTLLLPAIGYNIELSTLFYFIITSVILYGGVQLIKEVELPLSLALMISLLVLSIYIAHKIDVTHLLTINYENALLPYGVVLFALSSISAIPTIEEILDRNKKKMKWAIIWSGIIATSVVLVFGVTIAGITGEFTTQDAILGLSGFFGNSIIWIGALIGFLAIITSHLVIAHHMKEILHFDYDLPKKIAWGLTIAVPYIIFLIAQVNFITVVSFVGGVIGGITGNLVGFISLKSHKAKTREPEYCIKYDQFWAWVVIAVFSFGIIYQLYFTLLH